MGHHQSRRRSARHRRHARRGRRYRFDRWLDQWADDDVERLEELQRDLEEAAADVAERIRRLQETSS